MSDKERIGIREACRRRMPLGGASARALEHALTITERERNEAKAEVERLWEWLEPKTLCPCCGCIPCSESCTFKADYPAEWERMMAVRDLLDGFIIKPEEEETDG